MTDHFQLLRSLEALLFAASEPQTPALLARALPEGADVEVLLEELAGLYGNRGVALTRIGEAYCFRTAPDLAHLFAREQTQQKKLTRAAVEAPGRLRPAHDGRQRRRHASPRGIGQQTRERRDVLAEVERRRELAHGCLPGVHRL